MNTSESRATSCRKIRRQVLPARTQRRGAAVVELAFMVPFLALLVMGVVEYAQLTHAAQVVSNASRRGALYAAENETTSTATVETYVRDYISNSFANLSSSGATSAVSVGVADSAGRRHHQRQPFHAWQRHARRGERRPGLLLDSTIKTFWSVRQHRITDVDRFATRVRNEYRQPPVNYFSFSLLKLKG